MTYGMNEMVGTPTVGKQFMNCFYQWVDERHWPSGSCYSTIQLR